MVLAGVEDVKKNDHRAIASELSGEFSARNYSLASQYWP
jgi:hypothetical protein